MCVCAIFDLHLVSANFLNAQVSIELIILSTDRSILHGVLYKVLVCPFDLFAVPTHY